MYLRLQVREDRQLGHVVEDDEGEEGHDQHKCGLVDALLHNHADVAADRALDEQQQNHAAVENWEGQQVENAEVEARSEEHTSELQSLRHLVCRLLLEKKKNNE